MLTYDPRRSPVKRESSPGKGTDLHRPLYGGSRIQVGVFEEMKPGQTPYQDAVGGVSDHRAASNHLPLFLQSRPHKPLTATWVSLGRNGEKQVRALPLIQQSSFTSVQPAQDSCSPSC
jgi:hypothetical protein